MPRKNPQDEFNKELLEALKKIVHPRRLSSIYDQVISYQKSQQDIAHQKEILGLIQEYIQEIDPYLNEFR